RLHPPPGTNFLPWREHSVLQTGQSTVPQQSAGDVLVADDLLDQAVVEGVSPVSPPVPPVAVDQPDPAVRAESLNLDPTGQGFSDDHAGVPRVHAHPEVAHHLR